jgi:hypothetical protein
MPFLYLVGPFFDFPGCMTEMRGAWSAAYSGCRFAEAVPRPVAVRHYLDDRVLLVLLFRLSLAFMLFRSPWKPKDTAVRCQLARHTLINENYALDLQGKVWEGFVAFDKDLFRGL